MKKLAMLDALFLHMELKSMKSHVVAYMIYDFPESQQPKQYLRTLVNELREKPWPFPNHDMRLFRSITTLGQWAWIPAPERDMNYHVRHIQLPAAGGLEALRTYACDEHEKPMDYSRPVWELHVIEGVNEKQFAVVMKVHHCCIDGVSAMNLLKKCMSSDPAENYLQRMKNLPSPSAPFATEKTKQAIPKNRLNKFRPLIDGFSTLLKQTLTGKNPMFSSKGATPRTIFSGESGTRKSSGSATVPISTVKSVAKSAGVSVNDVVSAMTGRAMKIYLEERGGALDKSLQAIIPVSVHTEDDLSESNKLSLASYTMASDIPNALTQLQTIAKATTAAKKMLSELPPQVAMASMALFALPKIILISMMPNEKAPLISNTIISNVQGPKQTLYLNGAPMRSFCPISLIFTGITLNVTVLTYGEDLNIGITADDLIAPDIQQLADYMVDSLLELKEELTQEDLQIA